MKQEHVTTSRVDFVTPVPRDMGFYKLPQMEKLQREKYEFSESLRA